MTAFIRPSLILRMDLDERLFNDECVSDIKRSYSYVAPSLVQAHKPVDGQRPENVMRFMIKLHRAYWDKSDEAAQQLWEGVMPKWLHQHVLEGVQHHHCRQQRSCRKRPAGVSVSLA